MNPPRYALSRFAALSIGFGLVAFPARLALAEEVTWDNSYQLSDLQNTILGGSGNDLAPKGDNTTDSGYRSDSLSGNTVNVNPADLPVPGSVYGAVNRRDTSPVASNKVTIGNGGGVDGDVYGGLASSGSGTITVERNTVTIGSLDTIGAATSVGGAVYGGYAYSVSGAATAANNIVTTNSNNKIEIDGSVAGGRASSSTGLAQASGNSVTIDDSKVYGWVNGGYASGGGNTTASDNAVIVSNSMVYFGSALSGGYASSSDSGNATAANNTVSVSGSQVNGNVFGGYASSGAGAATATGNEVVISGSQVNGNVLGGYAHSASGAITVAHNTVTISGGRVSGNIYGGYADSNSGIATVTNNTVTINGNPSFGAATTLYGGYTNGAGDAFTGNTLNKNSNAAVSGARNFEFINFGYTGYAGIGYLDTTPTGSAQPGVRINTNAYNTITFDGIIAGTGSLTKDGAGILTLAHTNIYTGPTEVRGGTLALSGTGTISPMLALYGGSAFKTGGLNVNYLDQLDVYGSATWNGALSMGDGQTISFHIPASMGNGGTMLTVTDGSANIAGSTLTLDFASSKFVLQEGDQIKLINVVTPPNTLTATPIDPITTLLGITLDYTFDITTETNNKLLATVTSIRANEQTKSLSESFVSGPALLNQTTDFITGEGTAQAVAAAGGGKPGKGRQTRTITTTGYGLGTFGAVTTGWNRYDTGSNVDLSNLSLIAGLAWGNNLAPGRLTFGAFFEYGNGSYDTYNSFADSGLVAHGEGDIYHLGGGLLGRFDFSQGRTGNFYAEASLRAGSVTNDYKNGNLNGQAVNYGSESAYYGAHAGLGYVWHLTKQAAFDLYGKYFWTRQNGDAVRLSTDDPVRFADINSHRLRVGGRFVYTGSDLINPYAGLAYEQEFGGEAKATVYGFPIDAPSLQGGTGIGELGLAMKATKDTPLSLDLGVQGYVGTREGISGSLRMRYDF